MHVDGLVSFGCHVDLNKLRWLISRPHEYAVLVKDCTRDNTDAL